jgi:16S rRNA (guanine966-N2)-methyltransferase
MDPPYRQELEAELLRVLASSTLLKPQGRIIIEADEHSDFSYVEELGFAILREKYYKTNKHVFLVRRDNEKDITELR